MPELNLYEVAIYIYFLRHSLITNGAPYVRASRRGLQTGIVKSNYAAQTADGTGNTTYAKVELAINGLEAVGAIRQEGDANRDGTLYRILLPEEIEACQRRRATQVERPVISAKEGEADSYNIREDRLKIWERDNYQCVYCSKQLTRFTATLGHVTPVSEGGDNSADNLKTACLQCSSRKTARPLGDFLAERFPA